MPTMPPTHRPHGAPSRSERQRGYDRMRGGARERLYTSTWDRTAKAYLAEHPVCVGCAAAFDRVVAAEVVDHIEPHKGDRRLFWSRANWQAPCRWHHDVVKARLERRFARGEIGVEDLRLDSDVAVALTRRLAGEAGPG